MKQTRVQFQETSSPLSFDLLTSLAHHGGGELLDHVSSFVLPGRRVQTQMVVGDESGWGKGMHVASHGKMLQIEGDPSAEEFATLYKAYPREGPPLWMSHDTVRFTGIVSGGMLHLTTPATDIEVVQLTKQDLLSINTFPEVDRALDEHTRHCRTYAALIRRGTVFLRKADGSIGVTLGHLLEADTEDASVEGDEEDVTTVADVRDMVRKINMPVQDAAILNVPEDKFLTLEVVSKDVILKTAVKTFGKIPVAFRLDNMTSHSECASTHFWAMLVPHLWMEGLTSQSQVDRRNVQVRMNKEFKTVASAIVDTMLMSNSALVPRRMPIKREDGYCSIFDYTKVSRTAEGCRLKTAPLKKTAHTSKIFAKMCLYE
jgi:hypothetical protein